MSVYGVARLCALSCLGFACAPASGSETSTQAEAEAESGPESATASGDESGTDLPDPLAARLILSADFLAGSVSVLDLDALLAAPDGTDPSAFVLRQHDLSDWAPGPLEVEFVPGRDEAIVAVGPGFFGGIVGNLIDAGDVPQSGALLHIDLNTGEVLGSLDRPTPPMGLALTPDATQVLVADYGNETVRGDTVSFVELETLTETTQLVVGEGPEQIHISADGSSAIVNAAGAGTVRRFTLADPEGTLSAPLVVSGDPSWVHFLDEPNQAIVTNSADPANWAIVDLSDPSAPLLQDEGESISGFPYALTRRNAGEFVFTSMTVNRFEWHRVDVQAQPSALVQSASFEGSTFFPLGIALGDDEQLIVPMAGDNALGVYDLQDESVRRHEWHGAPGPTYVAVRR